MIRYIKVILVLVMVGLSNMGIAQTIGTADLKWKATGFVDLLSNTTVEQQSSFIFYGKQKIDWVQDNGNMVISFKIDKQEDVWANVNEFGSATLKFKFEGGTCKIVVTRDNQGLRLLLEMKNLKDGDIVNEYKIENVDVL